MTPWSDDVEYVLRNQVFNEGEREYGLSEHDIERLRDANFTDEQLRETFEDAFLSRSGGSVSPDERYDARQAFFDWMEYLGYDDNDYNWQAWREYMGY